MSIDALDPPTIRVALRPLVGPVAGLERIGAGAWSTAYGFTADSGSLVARIGRHREDFDADAEAAHFSAELTDTLPVPRTLAIAPLADGWVSITTRARGVFCEDLDAEGWRRWWPALAMALRTLWSIDPTALRESAQQRFDVGVDWPSWLRRVADDRPGTRMAGWPERLAEHPAAQAGFDRGLAALDQLAAGAAVGAVIPRLVHSDLINRNVLADGDRVGGVFDWGCCFTGDPLYDLAWLDFWSPWHPGLAALEVPTVAGDLIAALEVPTGHVADRWRACALHIGISHLSYNAVWGTSQALGETLERLAAYW